MCQCYSWGVARKICSIGERGMVAPLNHGIKVLGRGGWCEVYQRMRWDFFVNCLGTDENDQHPLNYST